MHLTIVEAGDLPSDAFLSVRVGETKRLRPFKVGESFSFKGDASGGGYIQLDAFEKLGSLMARGPLDAGSGKDLAKETFQEVSIPTARGTCISAKLKVSMTEPLAEKREKSQTRHKLALDAKNYLDCNDIWGPIQGMLHALLKHRPQDPVGYMISYLSDAQLARSRSAVPSPQSSPKKDSAPAPLAAPPPVPPPVPEVSERRKVIAADTKERAKKSLLAGFQDGTLQRLAEEMRPKDLGAEQEEEEVGGFPVDDCPGKVPDLAEHHSLMAEVLRRDGQIYEMLKDRRTSLGVTFARCLKPGMDNFGDPSFRTLGAVAGDEESYSTFRELFDPIIDLWHGARSADARHATDLSLEKISGTPIDPSGAYAVSVRVRGGRNFRGLRFPSACSRSERCEVEQLVSQALQQVQDEELRGEYFPLAGSTTFPSRPKGMTAQEEADLDRDRLLFDKPDSGDDISSGFALGWPHARGVFASKSRRLAVWCNEKEHLRVVSLGMGGDLAGAFSRFARTVDSIEKSAKAQGREYSRCDRLGYLSTCPSNLGTGLRVSVMLKLPCLLQKAALQQVCESLELQVHCHAADMCEVSNRDRLGVSEVDLLNKVINGCARLVAVEQKLEHEQAADSLKGGNDWCPGSFPRHACPDEVPDLSGHHSMMAKVLRNDPTIYAKLKDKRTQLSVSLATCIKSGVDNPSHPMLMAVGAVAGDEECYEVFRELFDPIIQCRHGLPSMSSGHPPLDLAFEKLLDTPIDPTGKYAISVRVRGHRSLSGLRLPPACDRAERIEVERALSKAMLSIQDQDLCGRYLPLRDSCSYPQKPNGMSAEEEEQLQEQNFLFPEPDSKVMLCSGLGRDWPEARGVFAADSQKLVAWVNEEDHLRLVSLQTGGGLKDAFGRFARAVAGIDAALASEGYRFARSERLGYVAACPSNLGTGLRASVLLRLPRLSREPGFQETCQGLGLQACSGIHSITGELLEPGVCDVANRARFGISELELIGGVIQGCARLVEMEQALERGEEL